MWGHGLAVGGLGCPSEVVLDRKGGPSTAGLGSREGRGLSDKNTSLENAV